MIIQNTVNDLIRVTTSSASALDVLASYVDSTATTVSAQRTRTAIAAAATTTIVPAPAASTERVLKNLSLCARGGANGLIVFWTDGTTIQLLGGAAGIALGAGETLVYTDTEGWRVHDTNGAVKTVASQLAGHLIRANGTDQTQRSALNFVNNTELTFTGTDDGANNETEIRGVLATNGILATKQAQMGAFTFKGNNTNAASNELDLTRQQMREANAGGVLTQTTSQTQTASVTNLTNGTYSIPANFPEAGSVYEVEGLFYAGRGATVTATNLIIELLINAVVIRTLTIAINVTASAVRSGSFKGRISIRTIGAGGTAMVTLESDTDLANGTAGTSQLFVDPAPAAAAPATTAIDTTVARTVELRMRLSAATATVFVHMLHCNTRKVK